MTKIRSIIKLFYQINHIYLQAQNVKEKAEEKRKVHQMRITVTN